MAYGIDLCICSRCGEHVAPDAPRIQSQLYKNLPMPYCQRCYEKLTKEAEEKAQEKVGSPAGTT